MNRRRRARRQGHDTRDDRVENGNRIAVGGFSADGGLFCFCFRVERRRRDGQIQSKEGGYLVSIGASRSMRYVAPIQFRLHFF